MFNRLLRSNFRCMPKQVVYTVNLIKFHLILLLKLQEFSGSGGHLLAFFVSL